MARVMSTLSEAEQMLLMRYHDGECSDLEQVIAEKLLNESSQAEQLLAAFESVGSLVREWAEAEAPVPVMAEQLSETIKLPMAKVSTAEPKHRYHEVLNFDWSSWLFGLGWASSGAMVAASLFLLLGVPGAGRPAQTNQVASENPFAASFVKGVEVQVQSAQSPVSGIVAADKLAANDLDNPIDAGKLSVLEPQNANSVLGSK